MKAKKYLLFLMAILLAAVALAGCGGLPRITNIAGVQATQAVPTAVPTATFLPGFTQTLNPGDYVLATNGVNRAIQIHYNGTLTDAWVCDDGSMSTCAYAVGNGEYDFKVDGLPIGHAKGATLEIFPGWGLTPGQE